MWERGLGVRSPVNYALSLYLPLIDEAALTTNTLHTFWRKGKGLALALAQRPSLATTATHDQLGAYFRMGDDGGGRKRQRPAWMDDHDMDAEGADDEERPAPSRKSSRPSIKRSNYVEVEPIRLTVGGRAPAPAATTAPRRPAAAPSTSARDKGAGGSSAGDADGGPTKQEQHLQQRYAALRALLAAQNSSRQAEQEREQAQNEERLAAAIAKIKQGAAQEQAEEKPASQRKLPSMRRSNYVSEHRPPDVDAAAASGSAPLDLPALWPGSKPAADD